MVRKFQQIDQCEAIVAIDIGYGYTKAVSLSERVLFPSVAGKARELGFDAAKVAQRFPGDQISDDHDWFIGNLALVQLLPDELIRLRGRNANLHGTIFRSLLFRAAIGKLFTGTYGGDSCVIHIKLATGLPVAYMKDAPALKAALLGAHRIKTDCADFVLNVSQVYVMPQGYAALYNLLLNADGSVNTSHTAVETAVIDVGTFTVDYARDSNGAYVPVESGSIESGVYNALDRFRRLITDEYKHTFREHVVERAFQTGQLDVNGVQQDVKPMVQDAVVSLALPTVAKARELWGDAAHVQQIYLMGGGAQIQTLQSALAREFPQLKMLPNPQWANVTGYLRYALFKATNQQ